MSPRRRRNLNLSKRNITFRPTIDQAKHILARCKVRGITFSSYMRSLVGDDMDRYKGVTKVIYQSGGIPPIPPSETDLKKRKTERVQMYARMGGQRALEINVFTEVKEEILKGITLDKAPETRLPMSDDEMMELRIERRERGLENLTLREFRERKKEEGD